MTQDAQRHLDALLDDYRNRLDLLANRKAQLLAKLMNRSNQKRLDVLKKELKGQQ